MRILKLYLLKEFVPPYLGSMAFFTMLLLFERVLSFVGLVAKGYATGLDLLVLLFFSVPPTLALTMPMSTVMGALVSVGRLSNDSEITAMKAGGIRLGSIFLSLYFAGFAIGGASFLLTDRLVPIGNIKFRTLYQRLTIARPEAGIESEGVNTIAGGATLLVEKVDEKSGDLLNVVIFEKMEKGEMKTITARKGWFLSRGDFSPYLTLRLSGGTIIDSGDREGVSLSKTQYEVFDMNIPINTSELRNVAKTPADMDLHELARGIEEMKKGSKSRNVYVMEYHKKIAIPFACVLFVFLGTPFAVTRGRSGKGLGLGAGVLIIFFYYTSLLILERAGRSGGLPPGLAVWLPNILFFVAGVGNLMRRGRT
jgi:LPS export ABC transporter permease LptF